MLTARELARSALNKFSKEASTIARITKTNPPMEAVYQQLFVRDLASAGIVDDFYPVGGASNYSLLYVILRIARELQPTSILDVGAGQSSVLWNRLLKLKCVQRVLTVEDNSDWAQHIASRVDHEILQSPLAARSVGGREVATYDWDAIHAKGPFDVVMCDGPRGSRRYSRYGVLAILEHGLPTDFVVIVDDAERIGEQDTLLAMISRLQANGRRFSLGYVRAQKTQVILAAGKFERAAYFGDRASL
jgi:hypothetical protein